MFETTGLWMVFLGPPLFLALVGGVVYLRKRLSISSDVFVKALVGIVIFVGAAAPGDILVNYVSGDAHIIQTAVEEFCEMAGVTLILWAAMTLLAQQQPIVVAEALMPARAPAPERRPAQQDLAVAGRRGAELAIPVPVRAHRQSS